MNKKILKILIILISFFLINISIVYNNYLDFKDEEIYESKAQILNIYYKEDFNILKLEDKNLTFYTSVNKNENFEKLEHIDITIITRGISFIKYIKGFYAHTLYYERIKKEDSLKKKIKIFIDSKHKNENLQELFNALFLAIPVNTNLREVFTNYGISHLIALSGLHLSVILFIIYYLFYYPYSFLQKKYFPFRNRRYDLILISICFLFFYLILTNIVPSLLRAFVMFIIGIFLLRNNIKLLSYKTLLLTFLLVISIFPKFLFSIGFWFSIIAVFYIFLYIQYFKNINKYFHLIFFNVWIFLVFNPIVHYFFPQTTYEQLFSPIITILFTLFYPFEIAIHILGFAWILDNILEIFINHKMLVFEIKTPLWFLSFYILSSLFSILNKKVFILLNILMIVFNIYLYV